MSPVSINFMAFLIVAILFASIAMVLAVPTLYIVGGAVVLLLIGLVASIVKQQPT
jgi:hypothetical protein